MNPQQQCEHPKCLRIHLQNQRGRWAIASQPLVHTTGWMGHDANQMGLEQRLCSYEWGVNSHSMATYWSADLCVNARPCLSISILWHVLTCRPTLTNTNSNYAAIRAAKRWRLWSHFQPQGGACRLREDFKFLEKYFCICYNCTVTTITLYTTEACTIN